MKKFLTAVLTLIMASALVFSTVAYATEAVPSTSVAEKTATSLDENGRFSIEIQVPGGDGENHHDEVIIMVDGSYSTDDDWATTREAIIEIGKTVLEGSGNTQLTVMTFGMGDNIVIEHVVSANELEANLTELPGDLLYGRSSTNCEAGFTGIQEYIEKHDETLSDVHVVYITDGEINTDETEYVFYNWETNTWLKQDIITLAKWSISEECYYYAELGGNLSNAYVTVFGDTIYTADEVSAEGVISDEDVIAWAKQAWDDVYIFAGLNPEEAYTVSDMERAFVDYDNANNTHIQEIFYYTLWGRSYPDRWTRTPEAGLALAETSNVAHIYMVDSNSATSWMSDMASANDNVSFHEAKSISNLLVSIESVITDLSYTPYNDVVIIDYMSKWVNLDTTTIKVVDNYANETIWTNVDGWLIEENLPTNQEVPVIIEEVPADEYEAGGSDVIGNNNGVIYKLTWYVKDGAMLRNHNYSLVYEVDVDVNEKDFKYGTYYHANGNTTLEYTEKNGEETIDVEEQITVPDVIVDKPSCEDKPEGGKPDCGNKPEGCKPDCGNKPEGGKHDCGNKPEGGKHDCGNKPEGGKPDCGNKPEGGKPDCGNKPEGGKPDCGNKPEGGKHDCGNKPEGGKHDCGNKPEGGKPDCGNKPEGGKPDCGNKPEGGKPSCENKPSCGNDNGGSWNASCGNKLQHKLKGYYY